MNWNIRQEKDQSGCSVLGILDENGERFDSGPIVDGISVLHERSNGLGGGFAAYGIYPDFKDFYCFHLMFENTEAMEKTNQYLEEHFNVELMEEIPHRHILQINKHPLLRRYFLKPKHVYENTPGKVYEKITDDEAVSRAVLGINSGISGAFVFSSGKNMGVFKGVGYPEDIAKFFRLEDYEAYCWIAHGRFPTNSQAWWGGAHPFSLLSLSVVHNGEISSYGINKRYLENFGYQCTLFTDTEVLCYLWDLFLRKQKLSIETTANILASPFWSEIEHMNEKDKEFYTRIRMIYSSALVNGPFGIIVGFDDGMIGLNDRLKLRPLVAARTGGKLYISSEECAIHEASRFKPIEKIWTPMGGELIIGRIKNGSK
ncbi:MAG: class II glutamine amidotransferase [Promethearchaeota archaeon]